MQSLRKRLAWCILMAAVALSCSDKKAAEPRPAGTPQEAAMQYYGELLQRRYDRFVAGMQSCDGKPADYREQMVTLMKQHYEGQRKENGGIKSVSVQRVEPSRDGKSARVFLNVVYYKAESEEIVVQMVLADGVWRMQ